MSNSESKWSCEYCTYENYPSALKCTMCRGAKPLLGENIYHLRTETPEADTDNSVCDEATNDSNTLRHGFWCCLKCGHVNWSIDGSECPACRFKATSNINTSIDQLQEELQPLRIGNNEASYNKWSCPTCTYDNWPKASNCVMCGTISRFTNVATNDTTVSCVEDNLVTNVVRPLKTEESTAAPKSPPNNCDSERRVRRLPDSSWLSACLGVVQGDHRPVEAFLSAGGDPTRQLTASEVSQLNRPSAFDAGYTLVHLAIRFQRENLLTTLLSRIEGSGSGVKRVPSYVAPELASDIRHHAASSMRQRKGLMACPYVSEMPTFALPADIEDLPATVQEKLFEELLDKDAQQQLEEAEPPVINWSLEVTVHLGSRLYALWNRSAGDCLLDSLMQTTWGVFDKDNMLRKALADALGQSGHLFYPRWREYESSQARLLHFTLDEAQWKRDWAELIALASQPGASLDQLHVFALAHILRRPIIVYGVKYVKSFRGEDLGYARFEGVYLPLLWEQTFCIRSPLALGYTRGHFSALVPIEPYSSPESSANNQTNQDNLQVTFLPLMDSSRKLLSVHFLTESEIGQEETILRQWLEVCVTEGGILVAQQSLTKRPLLVAQMLEEWLNHYRRIAQILHAPYCQPKPVQQNYSSDGDSDDESQFPEFSK